jgi:hypothetical protein
MQRTTAKKPATQLAESNTTWLGPALAGALVLVLLAVAAWYGTRPRTPLPTPGIGKETAELFLQQIRAGQAAEAWQSTTADFKSDEGKESFLRNVQQHGALWSALEFQSYESTTLNDLPRGQCVYKAQAGKALPDALQQVRIAVAKEGNAWKVEGMFLDAEPAAP